MADSLTILGIHGLGDHRGWPWKQQWQEAVQKQFGKLAPGQLLFDFVEYDNLFAQTKVPWKTYAAAAWKLGRSGLSSALGTRSRGLFDAMTERLKWYAGYVVAWVEHEEFKNAVRQLFYEKVQATRPDVILAHSLGSLISYEAIHKALGQPKHPVRGALQECTYVTLGSQLANPFVSGNLPAQRVERLGVKQWFHLYNEEDDVFTAPVRLPGVDNFRQLDTFFDIEGWEDHSAVEYLSHSAARVNVWAPLAERLVTTRGEPKSRTLARSLQMKKSIHRPKKRALLVGINDYPSEAWRLEGCVNDVYLMSELLQERFGFSPDDIRLCLNERATADGIRDRLQWLVDDVDPQDQRLFFYSGHGTQIPTYGQGEVADRFDEALVPYDFDWSLERAVIDDQIYNLYSQLPYDTQLMMIFDCCHSGGIHRDGGAKYRGLAPPDDIRHRSLRWDAAEQQWVQRDWEPIRADFARNKEVQQKFFGENGRVARLGRAATARSHSPATLQSLKSARVTNRGASGGTGPYLPLILEACQEQERAYEYRHGNQSFGAFTYTLAQTLRREKTLSYATLVKKTAARLERLGYAQTPSILGPAAFLKAKIA